MKKSLQENLISAIQIAYPNIKIDADTIEINKTTSAVHGDLYSNISMKLAKELKDNPINIANNISKNLQTKDNLKDIKVAAPGYINFYLNKDSKAEVISKINDNGVDISLQCTNKKIHIEYVSANPTGPLHVGHGRGMIVGDTTYNFLNLQGYEVCNEYYVNDAGRQIDLLLISVLLKHLNIEEHIFIDEKNDPEGKLLTYKGKYIEDVAIELKKFLKLFDKKKILNILNEPIDNTITYLKHHDNYLEIRKALVDYILDSYIKKDLEAVGIYFNSWFYESSLYKTGQLDDVLDKIKKKNLSYEKDGALWFKNKIFGEEKDRVLIKSNGDMTYFATDIAYHVYKFSRYDYLINIWGADHHDYAIRLKTALKALDYDVDNRLEIHLVQFANLIKSGESISMSTRSGEFYAISDLVREVGDNATRFFYLTKKKEHHLEFDVDVAVNQNKNNPVYYIQYAHARINKILTDSSNLTIMNSDYSKLNSSREIEIINHINNCEEVFTNAITNVKPDTITNYLYKLSQLFHSYYSETKILTDKVNGEKIELIKCIDKIIITGLKILKIEIMDKM